MSNYKVEDVVKNIKSDWLYVMGYHRFIELYNDDDWCNQFLSSQYQNFEIVIVRDVGGMSNGFYIVDRNYTKFTSSSFITKKKMKCVEKEIGKKPLVSMMYGLIQYNKTHSKSIDKYFIQYIKQNTILKSDFTFCSPYEYVVCEVYFMVLKVSKKV